MSPENVHLELRDDRQGRQAGTGVAYVRFTSPEVAEQARHSRHKQMMGIRYIECMISTPGMLQPKDGTWFLFDVCFQPAWDVSKASWSLS